MTTSLKSSALFANPALVVLLTFNKEYKTKLKQSGHSLVSFLSVGTERCIAMRAVGIESPGESVYGYSTSQVLNAEKTDRMDFRYGLKGEEDAYAAPVYGHGP